MILGDRCTRSCRFCNVSAHDVQPPDPAEPSRVAEALAQLSKERAARIDAADSMSSVFAKLYRRIMQVRLPYVEAAEPHEIVRVLADEFKPHLGLIALR